MSNVLTTAELPTKNDLDENVTAFDIIPSDPNAKFYFLPNGIGKERCTIFTNAIQRFHLQLLTTPENARFIIVDEQFDVPKVFSILKIDPSENKEKSSPIVIQTKWLSDSLKEKHLVRLTKDYIVRPPLIRQKAKPTFTQEPVTEEKKIIRSQVKRTLSSDEPQGGCATKIKQRRYSSDDEDDYDIMEVRQYEEKKERFSFLIILFCFLRIIMIQLKTHTNTVNYQYVSTIINIRLGMNDSFTFK